MASQNPQLASLSASLDELETDLEALFSQTLPETLVGLEPIQQAKLQTVLPYLVYDLIFIYLKTRGVDPKTHPVVPELDRIRQYFGKIANAANPPATKSREQIDKAAANRFIKHAIAQVTWKKTAAEDAQSEGPTTNKLVPVKVTSKMMERSRYEKDLEQRDAEDSEEETLEVFDDGNHASDGMDVGEDSQVITKGKGRASPPSVIEQSTANKRRRPIIDPFAGFGDDQNDVPKEETQSTSKKPKNDSMQVPSQSPSSDGLLYAMASDVEKTKVTRKKKKNKK